MDNGNARESLRRYDGRLPSVEFEMPNAIEETR